MDKLRLEADRAALESHAALRIATNLMARMGRELDEITAAVIRSRAMIAKSKLLLRGLYRMGDWP
jgi:hypothetical protein